jgi:hypothetical protein
MAGGRCVTETPLGVKCRGERIRQPLKPINAASFAPTPSRMDAGTRHFMTPRPRVFVSMLRTINARHQRPILPPAGTPHTDAALAEVEPAPEYHAAQRPAPSLTPSPAHPSWN